MQAAFYQAAFPARYRLVRYEDTATTPEDFARTASAFLGLDADPILSRPTLGGAAWGGNSGFGEKTGVQASIGHHADYLSADDRAAISEVCAPWLARLGYSDTPPYVTALEGAPGVRPEDVVWLAARQNLAYEMRSRGNEIRAVRWARVADRLVRKLLGRPLP